MKSHETTSADRFEHDYSRPHPTDAASQLLERELGGVVVDRCPVRGCEACQPLLLVAA